MKYILALRQRLDRLFRIGQILFPIFHARSHMLDVFPGTLRFIVDQDRPRSGLSHLLAEKGADQAETAGDGDGFAFVKGVHNGEANSVETAKARLQVAFGFGLSGRNLVPGTGGRTAQDAPRINRMAPATKGARKISFSAFCASLWPKFNPQFCE